MAFIKLGDTVINTSHIAAVELDHVSITGRCGVIILVVSEGGLFGRKTKKFWFDSEAAKSLRDYFSDPDHVIELVPSSSPRSKHETDYRGGHGDRRPIKILRSPLKLLNLLKLLMIGGQTIHHLQQSDDGLGNRNHQIPCPLLPFLISSIHLFHKH